METLAGRLAVGADGGAGLQLYILPATPWHAGHGLLAGGDRVMFQDFALKLAEEVQNQGWSVWTLRDEG